VDDVSINGPDGSINPASIIPLPETEGKGFRVTFPSQDIEGNYQVIIGPQVLNLDGDPMDQDKDKVNGEPDDDQYIAEFCIDESGPHIINFTPSTILLLMKP